jgi:hypothetical protein
MRALLLLTLVPLAACTAAHSISLATLRPGFSSDAPLEFQCVSVLTNSVNDVAQPLYKQGWRLVAITSERASFAGISSEEPYLCFERLAAAAPKPATTDGAAAPAPAAPPPVPVGCKHLESAARVRTRTTCDIVPDQGALLHMPAKTAFQLEAIYEDGTARVSGSGGGRGSIACSCLEVVP